MVFKVLEGIFDPIISPLNQIVMALLQILELAILFLTNIPELLKGAFQIFDLPKLINDVVSGVFVSLTVVFKAIFDLIAPRNIIKKGIPKDKNEAGGFFGFSKAKKNGKYVNPLTSNDRKCFPPTLARLTLMVICPPFALFTHVGLRRWYYIVICALLTVYGYYFPGLLYAALHILC